MNTAAFWNPEKMLKARCARESLTKVNQQIARKAAELLEQRNELHNTTDFNSSTHSHIFDVITEAANDNQLFEWYV